MTFSLKGATMIILKTFYWYQLHQSLGPLAISVKRVLNDIIMISIAYLVFYVSFTLGIGLLMHENIDAKSSKEEHTDVRITLKAHSEWNLSYILGGWNL